MIFCANTKREDIMPIEEFMPLKSDPVKENPIKEVSKEEYVEWWEKMKRIHNFGNQKN